jgi:uncharacterized circularly permuted ATP-grasp superfamily protein
MSVIPARERWMELLDEIDTTSLCAELQARMREARVTFGGRLLCSVLRPFFLTSDDEERVRRAAEMLARIGERVARAALEWPDLLGELGLTADELRLVHIDPGYHVASTASRVDAFLLPGTLQFAEYNAESPGGPGYSHRLADLFEDTSVMRGLRETFDVRRHPTIDRLLEALLASYRDWGGRETPPQIAIVDWREVPTWSEFELLRDAFTTAGVPTVVADPRDLTCEGNRLIAEGRNIDLVFRRVLVSDIVERPTECRTLLDAYERRFVCVANTLRCKLPHKKTFFAVLTDDRFNQLLDDEEREMVKMHVPWTRRVRDGSSTRHGQAIDLLEHARRNREQLVLKPSDEYGGSGVQLGWEVTEGEWENALEAALAERERSWILQERIAVLREPFPVCGRDGVTERDMLVDLAPYLFRGKLSGYLTRLSAGGLANVTSGGGQAASFVIEAGEKRVQDRGR